jgi:hypothetical protein
MLRGNRPAHGDLATLVPGTLALTGVVTVPLFLDFGTQGVESNDETRSPMPGTRSASGSRLVPTAIVTAFCCFSLSHL